MGFIGGYITPDFGITGEDRKNAYYVIDGIQFNSDITTTDDIVITIVFNIYPSESDRISRINLLGSEEIKKNINRTEFTGDILEEYYIYSKPLMIENHRLILTQKLGLDISDEISTKRSKSLLNSSLVLLLIGVK